MEKRRHDDNGVNKYMKMWPVILAFIAVISSFVVMKQSVAANSKETTLNRTEHREIFSRLDKLEVIVGMIPEMRTDIKTLLKGDRNNVK